MIKSFADKKTRRFCEDGVAEGFLKDVEKTARRKVVMLEIAENLNDLMTFPGNKLEKLKGNREGQYSIRINDRYRICFRFQDGAAYDVEITDYH